MSRSGFFNPNCFECYPTCIPVYQSSSQFGVWLGASLQAIYGGVEFGLDRFELSQRHALQGQPGMQLGQSGRQFGRGPTRRVALEAFVFLPICWGVGLLEIGNGCKEQPRHCDASQFLAPFGKRLYVAAGIGLS